MSISQVQFSVLFLGTFGQAVEELGGTIDASGADPVAKFGTHTVSLLVVGGNAVEWQLDGAELFPFTLNGRDERGLARKTASLEKLTAALG
jgi:hypothetical protein